jgi:uncharacterized cupredoxin-like copper-binding protein
VARAVQFDQPIIRARAGRWVRGVYTNEDTIYHDSEIDDLKDAHINTRPGQTSWATCYVDEPGVYEYSCAVPGHMEASMTEQLIVEP